MVSGSIKLNGQELVGLDDAAMCQLRGDRIGMVFQEPMTALNLLHTISDQIAEPLRLGIDSFAVSSLSFAKKIRPLLLWRRRWGSRARADTATCPSPGGRGP